MANIRQVSPGDPLSAVAINAMAEVAPILEDIQFYTMPGTADTLYEDFDAGEKTKITRSLNEDNSATPPTPVPQTITKKIISFDSKVDKVYEQRGYDIPTAQTRQLQREARQAGFRFQYLVFEGDDGSDAEDFDGLRNIAKTAYKNENGVLVPAGNSDSVVEAQQVAVETLLKEAAVLRAMNPIAYMNENLKIRWVTVAKNLGYYRQEIDTLGRYIERIGNLILKGAGYGADGAALLPFSETVNGGSSSSIFFVEWGEGDKVTALTSKGFVAEDNGKVGNYYLVNCNMDMVLGIRTPWSLVVSQGWKLS